MIDFDQADEIGCGQSGRLVRPASFVAYGTHLIVNRHHQGDSRIPRRPFSKKSLKGRDDDHKIA